MIRIRVTLFLLAFAAWVLLTWSVHLQNICVGLIVAVFVSFMTADLFAPRQQNRCQIFRYLWFLYYIPIFLWECLKANFDGAYRVIHPDVPLNPGIVKVKTALRSDTAITFLANTLSLKPGTMTVDVDKEKGCLYVHWVDVKTQDVDAATEIIVSKFEKILMRIFE